MKKIYTVDSDGIIEFVAEEFEEQRRMFAAAGLDIGLIRTEKDYEKAFKAAGDYFFGTLVQSAEVGDKASKGALQTFLSSRTSDFLATIRRGAFKLIDGTAPDWKRKSSRIYFWIGMTPPRRRGLSRPGGCWS
jgi:hypothetical protein